MSHVLIGSKYHVAHYMPHVNCLFSIIKLKSINERRQFPHVRNFKYKREKSRPSYVAAIFMKNMQHLQIHKNVN